ncbi:MAG: hypothetical protein HYZ50_17530 [Deltaproteobacteria bacterium]|nr:hypothetical protein [Deltaproteobacteria bacterium]
MACLRIATFLILGAFFVTWLILEPPLRSRSAIQAKGWLQKYFGDVREWPSFSELLRESKNEAFASICFFFAIFLTITYLISFALAFHDRAEILGLHHRVALYYQFPNESMSPPLSPPILGGSVNPEGPEPERKNGALSQPEVRRETATLVFAEGSALVEIDTTLISNMTSITPTLNCDDPNGRDMTLARYYNLPERAERIWTNTSQLCKIRKTVCYSNDTGIPFGYASLTLIGRASPTDIRGESRTYRSNYELSQARGEAVHRLLSEMLSGGCLSSDNEILRHPQIEWILAPAVEIDPDDLKFRPSVDVVVRSMSTPNHYLQTLSSTLKELEHGMGEVDQKIRGVERNIETIGEEVKAHPTPLQLLDYIYFTIYTITTTGYGDIQPVTGFAKFIVSLANLFEVFFLVIFFNALLSARTEGARDGNAQP